MLSGSNASVGTIGDAGGRRPVRRAHGESHARTTAPTTADRRTRRLAAVCGETACEPANTNWSAWGTAFGGAQWLNADSASGSPAAQQAIGGGAFGGDYRAGPQTLVGAGRRPQQFELLGGRHRRQRAGDRRAFRPLRPARAVSALLRQRRPGLQPLRRQRHPLRSPASARPRRRSPPPSPASWPGRIEVGRPFEVSQFDDGQLGITPFAALAAGRSSGRPASARSSVTASGGARRLCASTTRPQGTTLAADLPGRAVRRRDRCSTRGR